MKRNRLGYTGKTILIVILALLLTDFLLGYALLRQNRESMKELIDGRVLDVAKTAAAMLDGDVLGRLTAEDEGTPEYQSVYDTLAHFQNNFSLSYIYGIRDDGDGTFSFTVDPDPDDPDDFGETVVTTEALIQASKGTPSVDQVPFTDEWGRFYSAYCPVYDSAGNIAGIVGVDFGADWYDAEIRQNSTTILLISLLSLLLEYAGETNGTLSFPVPAGVYPEDILGVQAIGGIARVNLSGSFYRSCQGLDAGQERCLVYSMVNTLCALESIRGVRFLVEGGPAETLAGSIYLRSALIPNPGIVATE